tara:strand:- start:2483 stop:2917 length:435 start_codon:yes stop_codon:yes gene_type:complete
MLEQLVIGTFVICGTVLIQAMFIGVLSKVLTNIGAWLLKSPQTLKMVVVVTCMVIWLVGGLTASAWLWAAIFLIFDVFNELEPALYFSVVTFTTLGYGDVVLSTQWRLLGSLTAVNGLIIVGLNTAFLVEAIAKIRNAQSEDLK